MRFLQKQQHWVFKSVHEYEMKNDDVPRDKPEDHSTCVAFSSGPLFPSCGETLERQSLSTFFTLEEM